MLAKIPAAAFTTADANTIFTAYNTAFLSGGYYNGWWTGAEEIEMAEDAYENSPSVARQNIVSNACVQFVSHHTSVWTSGGGFNNFNDDICWAVLAFTRAYHITGSTNFLNIAKSNWDGMYFRGWDTNYLGGGVWWNTDNKFKNAAVNGPAAIGACMLYNIYGDTNYLAKAQAIYAWERRWLVNTNNGSIADGINYSNITTSGGATTYNQGTFIGAANLLYRATGLPVYYQDAMLVGKYTQTSMSSAAGIMPEYGSGDIAGFNGIFCRWLGKFAKDQNVWPAFSQWIGTNANGAWNNRNITNNIAWQKWATATYTNTTDSWGCSASVVVMQVADPSPADVLQISPSNNFTVVAQRGFLPTATNANYVLTNSSASAINWSLTSTSAWISVSATTGSLAAATSTNVIVSLVPAVATNLSAGRYYANLWISNTTSGFAQRRIFEVIVSPANAPLALTGYNARVLAPSTSTAAAPNASAFDLVNNYCFFQAGLNGATRGLPPDSAFTSTADGASVFQFGYGVSNALVLGNTYPSSATLTLVKPQALNSITLLACSANTAGTGGSLVLNFTNGTQSQAFTYNATDWFGSSTNVAIQAIGRLKISPFAAEDNGASSPKMYQTTINLAALGINQPIASITFTKPAGAGATQTTGIFAISAAAMPDAPAISVQPQSVANTQPAVGATFKAMATGAAPLSYQWFYSATGAPGSYAPLAGEVNTNLILNPTLDPTNAGSFVVVVTNNFGSVTSAVASLAVYRAPVIMQQPTPTNIFVFSGSNNTFSVTANAALPVNYFWRLNGNVIPGPNSSNYFQSNLQVTNSGGYSVIVSNAFGAVTSSIAALTVAPFPSYPLGQAIIADHPIGYWRLDETSGSVAHDYLFNRNGAYTPKVLLGQAGDNLIDTHKAARFGSLATSNSCVTNIPIDFTTTGNGTFTVEAWVNGGPQTTDAGVITKGYGSGGEQFNLDCGGGSHGFRFFVRDYLGGVHSASSSLAPNNQWRHVVGVCDSMNGKVNLYVDGALAASGTIATNIGIMASSLPVSFGARQSGANTANDFQFVGSMEEVAIYNYALSATRVQVHYATATNRAPVFVSNPFAVSDITAGQIYSGSIAAQASDPNGDAVIFTKVSGPSWLSVASNGFLGGTPVSSDVGANSFVVSARDPAGLSNSATMNLNVFAAPAIVTSITFDGNNLQLNWSGGIAPYQLQQTTNLANPDWQNIGVPTGATSWSLPATNPESYFRIFGQ